MSSLPPEEESIFNAARALTDPDKRNEYLRVACKGDRARRKNIDELLAAAEEAEAFFKDPAPMFGDTQSDTVILKKPGDVMRYFGDYEVEKEIGRGGMGVIYRARQTSLDRPVAIKMILSGNLADENEVRRFRTEAEAAANLKHPGIVGIHEVGVHDGQHYYSMDLVEGGNLEDRIREEPLSPGEAARCLKSVAEAVAYANARGILHRDLKPQNILLDSHGHPHITDFGLAKKLESGTQLTLSGSIMGSPGFMAPEQAEGDRERIDVRTDVYGLGSLLYAMLTGRAPIQGDNVADTIRRVTEEEPISPRKLNSKIAQDLETICLKCLAKHPSERYSSAAEVAEDLERFLNYEPVKARPAGAMRKTWPWWQKNPWKLVGILGLMPLALAAWIAALLESNRLASLRLQFSDEDDLELLNPFEIPPFFLFIYVLPLFLVLIYMTGRAFRRQVRDPEGTGELFHSVTLPAHAVAGATVFLAAVIFLFQQIRFWVWHPPHGDLLYVGFLVFTVVPCFLLAWIGLNTLWEAIGSHDSAVFKAQVDERLKRQLKTEVERKWTFGQLLLVSGSLIGALLLAAFLLFLLMNPSGSIPKWFSAVALLGAVMTFATYLGARRLSDGIRPRRWFWLSVTFIYFLAPVLAFVYLAPFAPMTIGWISGISFAVAHAVFIRVTRGAQSSATDNWTKIMRPRERGHALRLAGECAAVLVVLLIVLHTVENLRGQRYWTETEKMLKEAGVDLEQMDEVPKRIADENNFVAALEPGLFLRKWDPERRRWTEGASEVSIPRIPGRNPLGAPFEPSPFVNLSQVAADLRHWKLVSADSEAPVAEWLDRPAHLLTPVIEAAKRPEAQLSLERNGFRSAGPFPNFEIIRGFTQSLAIDAQYALENEDGRRAMDDLRALSQMHHMLPHRASQVTAMIAGYVAHAEARLVLEGMRRDLWTEFQLATLQTQLERATPTASLQASFTEEIFWALEILEEYTVIELIDDSSPFTWFDPVLPRGWIQQINGRAVRGQLACLLPGIDVAEHRIHLERLNDLRKAQDDIERGSGLFGSLARVVIPNAGKAMQTTAKRQALIDLTRIACALERMKLKHGAYPATLAELAPDWIDVIPHDITSAEPLIYRLDPSGGYTLYSRGLNQKDDGGHAGSEEEKPLDWVWVR